MQIRTRLLPSGFINEEASVSVPNNEKIKSRNLEKMLTKLCERIQFEHDFGKGEFVDIALVNLDAELAAWWTNRQAETAAERATLREAALAKLSQEEREVLGIK
jgi:hypothetical protein